MMMNKRKCFDEIPPESNVLNFPYHSWYAPKFAPTMAQTQATDNVTLPELDDISKFCKPSISIMN